MLLTGAAMVLAACGQDNQAEDGGDLNQSLTAQNIVANDVTAIDAVTGQAANMAADVDFTDALANELDVPDGNRAASGMTPRRPAASGRPATERRTPEESAPGPAPAPAAESTRNATE
ncbi:hypothetical protein GCM10023325_17900 [Sphingomonas lutea]